MLKLRNTGAVLSAIVFAQFLCTSLWFAGNGVLESLTAEFGLNTSALGHLTSGIQLGFIIGTLVFALLRLPDRYSPSHVFLVSAIAGALCNLGMTWSGNTLATFVLLRFLTGFCLAGIYPVGMKIASDYFEKGLGKAMGYLVGALVLGTALPHLLTGIGAVLDWRYVIFTISGLATLGGLVIGLGVGDGPYRKPGPRLRVAAIGQVFDPPGFRRAAFGYFGHMWELYAMWAFIPVFLVAYQLRNQAVVLNIPLLAFIVIALGALGSALNGILSAKYGAGRVATIALVISGLCCMLTPLAYSAFGVSGFIIFVSIWGLTVVADSPMFSTLVAWEAEPESRGTALTIVTCIGFAVSILSIQLLNLMLDAIDSRYLFLLLVPGPIFGVWSMLKMRSSHG